MDEVVRIGTLKAGARFALIDRTFTITGTVKHQSKGYTAVRLDGNSKEVIIGDQSFMAHSTSSTEWSSGTNVYVLKEGEDKEMDSVPIDSAALSGSGEPIPTPRRVPTPTSLPLSTKEKIVATKGKIKDDAKAQARIKLAELKNKEAKRVAKAEAGPSKAARVAVKCRCGCGGDTKGMFCPGHDARFYGWAKKIAEGVPFEKLKNFTKAAQAELSTKAKAAAVLQSHGA